jgi:hypothetical protein
MDTMCNVYTQYNVTIKITTKITKKITKYNNNIRWYLYNIVYTTSVW